MRIEIDIAEHHYNNIMALDSVSLGRVPYKGIIMYTINAIKHGRVLEQEPTTKNNLGVDCISREAALDITWQDPSYTDPLNVLTEVRDKIRELPIVTPQEPKTGHWITQWNPAHQKEYYYCSECREEYSYDGETGIKMNDYKYCPNCGADMREVKE